MGWILDFDDSDATLATVGGKGANLAKLARADLPVPPGFLVTTDAYQHFVVENRLDARLAMILERLGATEEVTLDGLETASAEIRGAFAGGHMPESLAMAILAAYDALGASAVAVRSSATAEDLPDLSFAGQQDTFLNVVRTTLLRAVIDCWSSLWTARAIGYRARNQIGSEAVRLAVVVQEMVESEASGVLFTANPLTGLRSESVVDATLGLGEALVSGQVEPDHFEIDQATGTIRVRRPGAKGVVIRGVVGGGTETVPNPAGEAIPALSDAALQELVTLGNRVQRLYGGAPQDIEWAWAQERLYLLQARPITSLFPVPENAAVSPPSVLFSFAAVQGVFDPFTPLGMSIFGVLSATLARTLGYDFAPGKVPAIKFAANRMWIDVTPVLGNALGRRLLAALLPNIVPAAAESIKALGLFDASAVKQAFPSRQAWSHLRNLQIPLLKGLPSSLRTPDTARDRFLGQIEDKIDELQKRARVPMSLEQRVAFVHTLFGETVPLVLRGAIPLIVPGIALQVAFVKLAQQAGMTSAQALNVTRGMPHNATTEMDLELWRVAKTIRGDAEALTAFTTLDATKLSQRYLVGALPQVAQRTLHGFVERYGMRGVAEIDMGRSRWREDPVQVMQMVQNYLRIDDPARAPDAVYARGQREAQATIDTVAAALDAENKKELGGFARFAASRARALAGLREYPKFTIVRLMGIGREVLDSGYAELAGRGVIESASDGVWLTLDELRAVDAGYQIDWKAVVVERKATCSREKRRTQVPDLLLGDGRAFYGTGTDADETEGTLRGQPVSAGIVEGICHVVLEPHNAVLAHGEILVCPATDPAWTPLFLSAGGLIMEVGGMMTHGSVVAREYGIPAVIGVRDATTRLSSGMHVRLNGSTGAITLLQEQA